MGAVTHIRKRKPVATPEHAPVDEILDHVVGLVDDLGRDLAVPEEELPTGLALPRASGRLRLRRETLRKSWPSIVAFAAVMALDLLIIEWFATR